MLSMIDRLIMEERTGNLKVREEQKRVWKIETEYLSFDSLIVLVHCKIAKITKEEIKDCDCRESKNFVQPLTPKIAQIISRSRDKQTDQEVTMSPTQKKMLTNNDNNDKKIRYLE